jgi:hypothetical protein
MREIDRIDGDDLKWSQPSSLKKEFELRRGNDVVATLKFRSSFGTFATAASGHASWTFKRVGFWQSKASIRASDSSTDLAVFKDKTWGHGGTLEFSDGAKFKATTNFWSTKLDFLTEGDEPLVSFKYGGVFRRSAEVEFSDLAKGNSHVPLLVLFGWYLVILFDSDNATLAAAAAT